MCGCNGFNGEKSGDEKSTTNKGLIIGGIALALLGFYLFKKK